MTSTPVAGITGAADGSTRDRLIAEGLQAFCGLGFDGVSLREVERSAGLGRGLVTHHFGTKEAFWRECVNWLMSQFHDEFQRQQRNLADVSDYERARVLMRVYVRFVAQHPEYTRLLVLNGADDSERTRWMVDTWIKPNLAFFNRVSGLGSRAASRSEAMAVYAFTGAASLIFMLPVEAARVFGVDTTDERLIEEFADLIVAWVGVERPEDEHGRPVSALDRALRVVKSRERG